MSFAVEVLRRVALLAASAGLLAGCSLGGDDGFDGDRWRDARELGCDPDNPRLGMYGELRSKLLDERPDRAEVRALLGPPDARRRGALAYSLGLNVIDCDSVEVRFGGDRRVARVRYVQG